MKIESQDKDGSFVVSIEGEIVSRDEQQAVTDAVSEKLNDGARSFVLDMSDVPYVSSLGIAALVAISVKVSREGGVLRLVKRSRRVAHILEMTKVADIFQTYENVDEALQAD
jgi:anti-sigma B factor antagonist